MFFHSATIHPIAGFCEPFSSLSHLLGAWVVRAFALPLLRRGRGERGRALSLAIFVATALFALSMSGIYHCLPWGSPGRALFQRLDHAGIFILIAGSFTPPHVILFRRAWRWGMLALIWGLATVGVILSVFAFQSIPDNLYLVSYVGLGWIGIFSWLKARRCCGFAAVKPVLWEALAYTTGALMVYTQRPVLIPGVIEAHELFHVAVLIGLAYHWRFLLGIADGRARAGAAEAGQAMNPVPGEPWAGESPLCPAQGQSDPE